jgi:hypothetical protein
VGVDPWATFPSGLVSPKPHRRQDPAAQALKEVVSKDGKLRLRHFARVKQLGSGDVGMVDLVQLVGSTHRFALKSLEKREMLERNKASRPLGLVVQLSRRLAVAAPGRRVAAGCGRGASRICHAAAPLPGVSTAVAAGAEVPNALASSQQAAERAAAQRSSVQVGRVRTEEAILSTVDHPFLATLYGTLQTGARHAGQPWGTPSVLSPALCILVRPLGGRRCSRSKGPAQSGWVAAGPQRSCLPKRKLA